jgi:hypothetical protein
LFVSPYNHLLFLPKTNKENDNNIDFSLSKEQNNKVILYKENGCYFLFLIHFGILVICFHGDSERHELATERSGIV